MSDTNHEENLLLKEFGYIRKTSLLKPDEIEYLKTIDPEYSKAIRILIENTRSRTNRETLRQSLLYLEFGLIMIILTLLILQLF